MTDQVAPDVKAERCRRLAELEVRLRERYFASLLGRELEVLVESPASVEGRVVGTACRYAPVELRGTSGDVGHFVRVTPKHVAGDRMMAL